ncbi:hypothetical protein DERP_003270 [Dermatophagoides pteronyssinus]|uniref:Uncharacterized protein n=1 Tax=Dermatophagoides pteronyssinus TaxID=6956 RepID=A0ABQ8JJ15_DERPT|nr:hypothetical protein DERP_003270 [Dermatophagoides pteronyssinus]
MKINFNQTFIKGFAHFGHCASANDSRFAIAFLNKRFARLKFLLLIANVARLKYIDSSSFPSRIKCSKRS